MRSSDWSSDVFASDLNGDPNGDSAPPRPSEAEAIEAKEEPITPTDKPVVEEAEPVSEVPSEAPAPEQPVDGSPPQPSSASFSELTGTGTLAMGADRKSVV